MQSLENRLTQMLGIRYPIICGAMYPCSNPELVAAASQAGAIGIVQPISLSYVYGYPYRDGLRKIRSLTTAPIGVNVLVEQSSKIYIDRMRKVVDESLDEGVRFFITALGSPDWVVEKVHARGGIVFHDVTERKWAERALKAGVDGLICVNNTAGGHAGTKSPEALYRELNDLGVPLVCAGGVGDRSKFKEMLDLGYLGVQMGTRFIATKECRASDEYKRAILKAESKDVVLTEKITGVPVSVIRTEYVDRIGTHAGPIARFMLKHRKLKHYMRLYYSLKSFRDLRRSIVKPKGGHDDYWQAGKSVDGIDSILSVKEVIDSMVS